jgi:branched-chain amino acid transport system ATP-binding protein
VGALLDIREVTKVFGGLTAVDKVGFTLAEGEVLGLVGPNGSGKSTLLNVLSGVYDADGGEALFRGRRLTGRKPHAIAAAGVARTFQNLQLFGGLTIGENVLIGRDCRLKASLFGGVFGSPFSNREEREARALAGKLLAGVGLGAAIDASPSSLSYGQRRLLEVARALASEPKVLMLDEPCAGLSQGEADALSTFIRGLAAKGMGVIVIEHNMRFVMNLVDRIVALNFGQKIAEGAPAEIRENAAVIAAYLGRRRDARG